MPYQNFYSSKITNDIGAGDTTIIVDNAPTSTSGRMVLEARNTTQREIIKYTGLSGNTLTGVTRGQGGTTAKSHVAGALIQQNATAEDLQDLYDAFASFSVSANDWRTLVPAVTGVVANGNRSYDITFASTVASLLSNGMRLRTTRTVPAPTQCTSLNGTTQYYSKSSPAAMTFTDDFVVSAWVKLTSYPSGDVGIMNRGTSTGFWYGVNSSGRVILNGFKSGGGNFRRVTSYQSLPLNKWVHISAQLDMSTYTATTTTCYVMIDGVDVPAIVEQGGSNPADISGQTGDLNIGAIGGANFFPGKIAQVAIYNAKVTQATILASISQGLAGTETSLISAYSFNNTINDLNTTNANNLTANGSAVATNADSPFGNQADGTISSQYDYHIVQKVNGAVVTVQTAEGCTIPTSGGVSAVSYSTQKVPYGMPVQRNKWTVVCQYGRGTRIQQISPVSGTWYNIALQKVTAPIGEWRSYYTAAGYVNKTGFVNSIYTTLSTGASSESDITQTAMSYTENATARIETFTCSGYISATTATPYYLNYKTDQTSVTVISAINDIIAPVVTLENAYL